MPRLLYALTAVILVTGRVSRQLRMSSGRPMSSCPDAANCLKQHRPCRSTSRPLARSDTHADGWRACGTVTFTDLGAREMTAVFSMVSPIAEYQLLQF